MPTPTDSIHSMSPAISHGADAQFQLLSHWHVAAPVEAVWEALKATGEWPRWWRYRCSAGTTTA